ncbi:MAG: VWA domain-containing protein [Selenomonadaceae bacterium]|nr:VWA domain-containing protein [Selenomonadaceae bacterium]
MANITELVFILDKSGSMSGLESDTIGGFNSMIKKQQSEDEGTAFVSTVLFSNRSQVLHDRIPLEKIEPLTEKDYVVGGTTALLDAVGDAIKHIRNIHKYAREEDRPSKTVFIITTDGMENASRKFNYSEIKRLIEQQKEFGWEFVFLGANIDAVEVADSIGIDRRRAVNYHSDERGTEKVYGAMSNFVSFMRAPSASARDDDSWREDLDEDFRNR